MEFYLNNELIDNVNNGVVVNEALDDTLYSASVILSLNDQKEAIKPYTPFRIYDNGEELCFVVQSDDVELQSKSPLIYQHNLKLIEETELLKVKQIRNTICQQPSRKKKAKVLTGKTDVKFESEPIVLHDYERVSKIYLKVFGYQVREYDRSAKPAVGKATIYMNAEYHDTTSLVVVKNNGQVIFSEEKAWKGQGETIILPNGEYNTLKVEVTLKTPSLQNPYIYYTTCAKLYVETYYYSLLDIISLIRTRSNNSFVLSNNLIELDRIIAPNFAFTENNVYEALSEVFSYIDGRPILRKGELDVKYYNQVKDKEVISEDLTGYKSSLSSDKYANGLLSKFQNGGFETPIIFPSKNDYASPKPTDLGVPTESGWAFIVDKKIRYLESLIVKGEYTFALTITGGPYNYNISMGAIDLDLTDYVYEDTNYLQLPKIASVNFSDLSTKELQNNSFHYKSGSNEINYFNTSKTIIGTSVYGVGFTLFRAFHEEISREIYSLKKNQWDGFTINDKDLNFRVSYYPILDGKVEIEQSENKYDGLIRLSQSNGATSINRMGQNLYGQLLRMGNEERVAIPKVTSFKERYKVGDFYENDWVVNKATTTIFKSFSSQTLQLTKNYNKMSQFIRFNQLKRFNEIDNSVVGKSEEIVKEYLYLDTKTLTKKYDCSLDFSYLINGLFATINGDDSFSNLITMSAFTNDSINYYVKIPMVTYGSGNALCFEFSFESPISAGTQLVKDEEFYGEKYFSKYCLYADENGRFNSFTIDCGHWVKKLAPTEIATNYLSALPYINTTIDYSDSILGETLSWNSLLKLERTFNKQANEIFALNYEILCLTQNKNLFIGNAFISKNKLVDETKRGKNYLWFSNEKYSVMDTLAKGTQSIEVNATRTDNAIILGLARNCKAWAIANEQGELLLSCNEPKENGENLIIYFSLSKERI